MQILISCKDHNVIFILYFICLLFKSVDFFKMWPNMMNIFNIEMHRNMFIHALKYSLTHLFKQISH